MKMKLARASSPFTSAACEAWREQPLSSGPDGPRRANVDMYAAEVPVPLGAAADRAFDAVRARMLAYDIFTPSFFTGVLCPPGTLAVGTLIAQRAQVGPLALEMAVRVVEVWDRDNGGTRATGFRYVTIRGHAERGVAGFDVRQTFDGRVVVTLDARSRPGNAVAVLGRPVARRIQRTMTRRALQRLVHIGCEAAGVSVPLPHHGLWSGYQ